MSECAVLPGIFGVLVQGLLFLCVLGILCYKKSLDPNRSWFSFCLDSSKQIVGSGWIHLLNLLCAIWLHKNMGSGDQCEWYWINIMVDTTVGVAIEYFLLWAAMHVSSAGCSADECREWQSGEYYEEGLCGEPVFKVSSYVKQLCLWLVIVSLMKLSMVELMMVAHDPLQSAASSVLGTLQQRPQAKLIVVMIVTPLIMNAFQLWVVDSFIKKQDEESGCGKLI